MSNLPASCRNTLPPLGVTFQSESQWSAVQWCLGDHSHQHIQPSGSTLQTDMPSLNPIPTKDLSETFNGREPSEARFHPLDVGLVVSVAHRLSDPFTHNHSNPVAATVGQVGPELVVQLARPHQKLPFKERDEVLIKYWDEDRIVYYWQANVKNCSSVGYLTLNIERWNDDPAEEISESFCGYSLVIHHH